MPDDPISLLLVLATLAFLGWFALGTQWNVRKGKAVLRWLQEGLPLVGERTTMNWVGSAALKLTIVKASAPFRSIETLALFEPRDVVFLWAWARARGRRDLLIVRAQLDSAPKFEFEVFDPHGWTTHHAESEMQKKNWAHLDLPATPSLLAYHSGNLDASVTKSLIDLATRAGGKLMRLSVRRNVPNLEIHWLLPDVKAQSSRDLFSKLRKLGEDVTRG